MLIGASRAQKFGKKVPRKPGMEVMDKQQAQWWRAEGLMVEEQLRLRFLQGEEAESLSSLMLPTLGLPRDNPNMEPRSPKGKSGIGGVLRMENPSGMAKANHQAAMVTTEPCPRGV